MLSDSGKFLHSIFEIFLEEIKDQIWLSANNRKVVPISDLKLFQNIYAQAIDKVLHYWFRKDNKFIFCNFGPELQLKETITNPEYFPETLHIQNESWDQWQAKEY